jgi:hypothetical protein
METGSIDVGIRQVRPNLKVVQALTLGYRKLYFYENFFRTPHESSSTPGNYQNTLVRFLGSEKCSPPRERGC